MCCDTCPKYEKCEKDHNLKDNCCPQCPDYEECAGMDDREKDSYRDNDNQDFF